MGKDLSKFQKFILSGFVTFGTNLGLTILFKEIFNINEQFAYAITLIIVSIVGFVMNLKITFKANFTPEMAVKYFTSLAVFNMSNFILVIGFSSFLRNFLETFSNFEIINIFEKSFTGGDFLYYFSILTVTMFVTILKFFFYQKFIFIK